MGNITDHLSANVLSYTISVVPVEIAAPEINVTIMADDLSSCTNMTCKYTFEDLTEMSVLSYNIYVTAKNILFDGYSENSKCTNRPISKKLRCISNNNGVELYCSA